MDRSSLELRQQAPFEEGAASYFVRFGEPSAKRDRAQDGTSETTHHEAR